MSKFIDENGHVRDTDWETRADFRWVDKAISIDDILKTTAKPFMDCRSKELQIKVLDHYIATIK